MSRPAIFDLTATVGKTRFARASLIRRRIQYELRTVAADYPAVYLPFVRRTHAAGPGKVLASDTQLVIDGFTRSASTFAVFAFQLAQPDPVRVARHVHAPAQLIAAARREVPTLVCVRPPGPTVLSEVIREPHVTIAQGLRSFARFYERILPYRDRFVVATFEQVTRDFGAVIRAVNGTYGTSFGVFDHTDANVGRCFELIELRSRQGSLKEVLGDYQSGFVRTEALLEALARTRGEEVPQLNESMVARPSAHRASLKARLKSEYDSWPLERYRSRAERAYASFIRRPDS